MAVDVLGAAAPDAECPAAGHSSPTSSPSSSPAAPSVPTAAAAGSSGVRPKPAWPPSTHTRLNHGVVLVGGCLVSVYSTRNRRSAAPEILITVGDGPLNFTGGMAPVTARLLAHALNSAAAQVERCATPADELRRQARPAQEGVGESEAAA